MSQLTKSPMPHILLDERGRAWIDDTNVKVIEVVLDRVAYNFSPEETVEQSSGVLSLAQVHAALAYYYDHKAEFDAEIARQAEEVERLRLANLDSPIHQKLRALGKIP